VPTIALHCRSVLRQRSGWRRLFLSGALLLSAMLAAGTVRAQDYIYEMREAAKTWAMHKIAVIQASAGDVEGAKQTVSQIRDEGEKGPSEVTVVWFCNGQPVYDHPPGSGGRGGRGLQGVGYFFAHERAANRVPSAVPPGLPVGYVAADPRHGALVDFTDDYDSRGTRVTSRKYADGHVVIETPRADNRVK
jgi:hypothetical protein